MTLPRRPSFLFPHLPRVVGLVFAVAAGSPHAEHWVDVPSSSTLLQLDSDSVAPAGTNRFTATWRTGTAPGRAYFVHQGVVDCAGESLQLATSTYVDTDAGRGQYGSAVTDFAAGTRTWQARTTRLTAAERAEGSEFPSANDAAGRLLRVVCGEPDPPTAPPNFLELRLGQVQQACVLTSAQTARLRAGSLAPSTGCADKAGCSVPSLQAVLTGLGSDLSRAAAGQACAYVPEALDRLADGAAERAATEKFQACVARTVPLLDDRVSQADVVAKGVFGACRGELPSEIAQGPTFANGLLPGLTAAVLKHRSEGRARIPTPPKRPQAE